MIEKNKSVKQNPSTPPTGFGGGALPENRNVSVSSGPYAEELPVAGMTVGAVRKKYATLFDIAPHSQSILNGNATSDDIVLQVGQSLMFIQHAGEKGADTVMLKGDRAFVMLDGERESKYMPIPELMQRVSPGISTGEVVLPFGVKTVLSQGPLTLWIWEQPPTIQRLSWIRPDSPKPYGSGTTYRPVRIALPYLIIAALFCRDSAGMPVLMQKDECFFRDAPLKSLDDELFYPGLLNCSLWHGGDACLTHPLSWICTQHLKHNKKMQSKDAGERYQAGFEAVRYCLLETSFNLSSEHHEGNSWFGRSKQIDKRISTVERWEEETQKDPLFVLDVPWISSGHTVRQFAKRVFQQHQGAESAQVKSAADLGRIIMNG